jgi:hypothetical protein
VRHFIENIRKYLQWAGIHVRRFPTPEYFYKSLKYQPAGVKIHVLRRIASTVRDAENHGFYEELLKAFVPNWQVNITKAVFMGKGAGECDLNVYRKVRIENKLYFEKIYFTDYPSFKHIQFFQAHIYKLIQKKIKVPYIRKIYSGELLTIVYYDYLVLNELEVEKQENRLIQFSKYFYHISCENASCLKKLELPDSIKNFRKRFKYRNNILSAKARLSEKNIETEIYEKSLSRSKHIFTHGDLHEDNSFKQAVLVDWDNCGIYPLGFEPAYMYYCLMLKNNKRGNVINWLRKHYMDTVLKEDWRDFEQNFTYLLFVFSMKLFEEGRFKTTEQRLIKNLKKS